MFYGAPQAAAGIYKALAGAGSAGTYPALYRTIAADYRVFWFFIRSA
jgi:hypothetical protein